MLLFSRKRRTEGKAAFHLVTITIVALAACTELAMSFGAASKMLCINNLGRFPDSSWKVRCATLAVLGSSLCSKEGKDKKFGTWPWFYLKLPAWFSSALVRSLTDGERDQKLNSPRSVLQQLLPKQPGYPAVCSFCFLECSHIQLCSLAKQTNKFGWLLRGDTTI